MSKYWVVRDTRERNGYWVPETDASAGTVLAALKTGDYSIQGCEQIITVERKFSSGELYGSLTKKRFTNELERLQSFPVKCLLLEFTLADLLSFPKKSGIPESKWPKLLPHAVRFMQRRLIEIQISGIPIVFAGNTKDAEMYLRHMFKVFHEGFLKGLYG